MMMEEYNTASLYFTVENYARKMLKVYSRQQQRNHLMTMPLLQKNKRKYGLVSQGG